MEQGARRDAARVQRRVGQGGHGIAGDAIRRRYDAGRLNLIRLLHDLHELRLYDNSLEADPAEGQEPRPRLLLRVSSGRIVAPTNLHATPAWAKPMVVAALKLAGAQR
jgi:predicted ABC-type ATPase